MEFKEYFEIFANEREHIGIKVDKKSVYYQNLMSDMKGDLIKYSNQDLIRVEASVGQGNYAEIPWICLLSRRNAITSSPQKGLYVVILFSKDGHSLYISLNQGITNFNRKYLDTKQRNYAIRRTVEYFRSNLPDEMVSKYGFSQTRINLGEDLSQLAKGYIKTNIISKKFLVKEFDEKDFYNSLSILLNEYEVIINHIGNKTYDDVLDIIVPTNGMVNLEEALEDLEIATKDTYIEVREFSPEPMKVSKGSIIKRKYVELTREKTVRKTDYLKQAHEQHNMGLKGEELALEIEKKRLIELELDPYEHIKWRSTESDNYGYDIESVDIKNGKLIPIYIEVKATKSITDVPFFITKNEVDESKIRKDQYIVLRIFDITSKNPKYYIADGDIEKNFYIDPISFTAKYKYEIIY